MRVFWLISGSSRGLGAALADRARARGDQVLGIARSGDEDDSQLRYDLSDLQGLEAALGPRLRSILRTPFERYVLVNNAATLAPIGTRAAPESIERSVMLNLAAAMALARLFIAATEHIDAPKRIVQISSGAASRPIHGWSVYCACKAGLEHFGRCIALEQSSAAHPCDVVSISPGVIDTGMQAQIRASDEQDFPELARFRGLHAEGALATPQSVADQLLAGCDREQRYQGRCVTIAQFAAGSPG